MVANDLSSPLVSVVVITYNSSATVLETLDSIKYQTYKNIELIITDDASKDNTIDVCRSWLNKNSSRFISTQLITSSINTGVSGNANRGFFTCNGEWIKIIAADDRLLPECLNTNVAYINKNPNHGIVFSKIVGFGNLNSIAAKKCEWMDCHRVFEHFTQRDFLTVLCFRNFLPAASVFIKKSVFVTLGGFNESIPFIEDWPFWVKYVSLGYSMGFNNAYTAEYRFSQHSVSQQSANNKNKKFIESNELATNYAHSLLPKLGLGASFYSITTFNRLKYNSLLWRIIHYINVFNPFFYHKKRTFKRLTEYLS